MIEIDWKPLLCEIAALRLELRASSLLTLAAAATNHASKDDYLDQAFKLQGCADQVAKGSKS